MIKPADVGKRVTLQFFTDDGDKREAVGVFERFEIVDGRPLLHIRRRDDTLIGVRLDRIRHSRVIA